MIQLKITIKYNQWMLQQKLWMKNNYVAFFMNKGEMISYSLSLNFEAFYPQDSAARFLCRSLEIKVYYKKFVDISASEHFAR